MIPVATIFFQPVIPLWVMLPLWAVGVLLSWLSLRGCGLPLSVRLGMNGIRFVVLTILLWLMLAPERRNEKVEKELPLLAVAVDVSASMTEKLPGQPTTRAARVAELLGERRFRNKLDEYRVWWFQIGDGVEESTEGIKELRFNAAQTQLSSGLNRIAARLQGQNAAGMILLSDGLDQSGAALSAESRNLPILALELENPVAASAETVDYWIADTAYPQRVVVNWQAGIEVLVRRRGQARATFPLKLLQNGKEIESRDLAWEPAETFKQVSFSVTPAETGQFLFRVEMAPPNDTIANNNSRDFMINVTDTENRVLYLESTPRWEFKFLKRALMAEKSITLSAFVSNGRGGFMTLSEDVKTARDAVPPFTRQGLEPFKIIILGNLPGSGMKAEDCQGLREFVDRGGGLLLVGGDRAYAADGWTTLPALNELLPATPLPGAKYNEGKYAVDITAEGKNHAALAGLGFSGDIPPLLTLFEPVKVAQFSSTLLATSERAPLLVIRRFGQGKVAMILTDSFWRWQLGGAESAAGKNLYKPFFAQLVQWLGPSAKDQDTKEILQLLLAENEVEVRRKVTIGARLESAGGGKTVALSCRIDSPDGKPQSLPMTPAPLGENVGLTRTAEGYACEFRPQVPGVYAIAVASADGVYSAKTRLLVKEPVREQTGASLNREYLQSVAKSSGGQFYAWKDRTKLLGSIKGTVREIKTTTEYPLWPKWYWLAALIVLFGIEWWWRRKLDFV